MVKNPLDAEDVEQNLSQLESALGNLGPGDEYLEAILRNQKVMTQAILAMNQDNSGSGKRGVLGGVEISNLPTGVAGTAMEEIPNDSSGVAVFEVSGSKVAANVKANEDIDENDGVVIIGDNNLVSKSEDAQSKFIYQTLGTDKIGSSSKAQTAPGGYFRVMNEQAVNETSPPDVIVDSLEFSGDLAPGDTEIVAYAKDTTNDYVIQISQVGMTGHTADIDGDNEQESVVEYHLQYKESASGDWKEMKGASGTIPFGSMDNPEELIPNSFLGPVSAFRVYMENRTDDSAFTDVTVEKDDIGGVLTGRIRPRKK